MASSISSGAKASFFLSLAARGSRDETFDPRRSLDLRRRVLTMIVDRGMRSGGIEVFGEGQERTSYGIVMHVRPDFQVWPVYRVVIVTAAP